MLSGKSGDKAGRCNEGYQHQKIALAKTALLQRTEMLLTNTNLEVRKRLLKAYAWNTLFYGIMN